MLVALKVHLLLRSDLRKLLGRLLLCIDLHWAQDTLSDTMQARTVLQYLCQEVLTHWVKDGRWDLKPLGCPFGRRPVLHHLFLLLLHQAHHKQRVNSHQT